MCIMLSPIAATGGIALGNGLARWLGLEGSVLSIPLLLVGGVAVTLCWAWPFLVGMTAEPADPADAGPRAGGGEAGR